MKKIPTYKTKRLTLRPFNLDDAEQVVKLANVKEIFETSINIPNPFELKDAIEWINTHQVLFNEGSYISFAITLSESKKLIGAIGLTIDKKFNNAELGYWIGKDFWNNGFASEAIQEILRYAFEELKLNKIYAHYLRNNLPSGKVLIKNGMKREGIFKQHIKYNGEYSDIIYCAILAEEYAVQKEIKNDFPKLESERLLLRQFRISDAKKVQELAGHKLISQSTLYIPHPYPDGLAESWITQQHEDFTKGTVTNFAITLKETGELIGSIGLVFKPEFNKAEFGYWIGVPYWNNGYATEALSAILKYGFKKLKLNKMYAYHFVQNPASGKVMINNGLREEGYLLDDIIKEGNYIDLKLYSILRSEYEENNI